MCVRITANKSPAEPRCNSFPWITGVEDCLHPHPGGSAVADFDVDTAETGAAVSSPPPWTLLPKLRTAPRERAAPKKISSVQLWAGWFVLPSFTQRLKERKKKIAPSQQVVFFALLCININNQNRFLLVPCFRTSSWGNCSTTERQSSPRQIVNVAPEKQKP